MHTQHSGAGGSELTPQAISQVLARHPRVWVAPDGLRRAAVTIPLLPNPEGLSVLLTQRTQFVEHHKGEICFPGGGVDPDDDNSLQAALREAWEEVGIQPEDVQVLGKLDDYVSISGYRVRPYVIFIDEAEYPFTPQPREVEQLLMVPLGHLLDPSNHRSMPDPFREDADRHEFVWGDRVIWGLTAAILYQFLHLVFGAESPS